MNRVAVTRDDLDAVQARVTLVRHDKRTHVTRADFLALAADTEWLVEEVAKLKGWRLDRQVGEGDRK